MDTKDELHIVYNEFIQTTVDIDKGLSHIVCIDVLIF